MEEYVLSVDVGTTGCKAALFDREGHVSSEAYQEYTFSIPKPDWAEQDPDLWWNATQEVIKETLAKSKIPPKNICGVGITGQSPSIVPVGRDGHPLRPAIIWMDQRARKESQIIERETGKKMDHLQLLPKILWLRENEPDVYRRTYKFFEKATDYIAYVLTGTARWAALIPYDEVLEAARLLKVDFDKLPEVKRSDSIVGEVMESVEEATGLRRGTPVVSGGADGICSIYGTGVTNAGDAATVVGTSTCIDACLERKIVDPQKRVWTSYNLMIERWIMAGCANTSGASYKWFRDKFCQSEAKQAEEIGVRLYELLDRQAERVKPGCGGMLFLPYLNGERSPIWDPDARGVFYGMTSNHGKADFLRSILEGTAFSFYDIMRAMEESGAKIDEIRICGGGAKSPLWRQIKADVSGKPILLPEVSDASLLGAAILASRAVGLYGNIEESMRNMVRIVERNDPDDDLHYYYSKLYEVYRETYLDLRNTFKKTTSLR